MKRFEGHRRFFAGEGWPIRAALVLVLLIWLLNDLNRLPRCVVVPPVRAASQAAGASVSDLASASPTLEAKRIDLNAATKAELETLPGIGEVLAERILAGRAALGRFDSMEALLQLEGIGEGKLNALRDYVCVEPPASDVPQ